MSYEGRQGDNTRPGYKHERHDCIHYAECLDEAARLDKRNVCNYGFCRRKYEPTPFHVRYGMARCGLQSSMSMTETLDEDEAEEPRPKKDRKTFVGRVFGYMKVVEEVEPIGRVRMYVVECIMCGDRTTRRESGIRKWVNSDIKPTCLAHDFKRKRTACAQ
jgi:hypothetical protein